MNSSFGLRVSANAAIIFLLMNLLLIASVFADSGSQRRTQEVHQPSELSVQLSDGREGAPTPQQMRFRRAGPPEILSAVPPLVERLSQPHSDNYEALIDLAHAAEENGAAHSASNTRRLLRDISPPGMWPPGSYDDESLPSMSRRRFLATAESDRTNDLKAGYTQSERLPPSVNSLLRTSARGVRRLSDSLTSKSRSSLRTGGRSLHQSSNFRR